MDIPRLEITIRTVGIPLEKLSATLGQIKESFSQGYIEGSAHNISDVNVENILNDANIKNYTFETKEW